MKAPMSKQASQLYEFGPFRVDPRECLLLRDGEALALTPKAFETLLVLVQNAGHLMAKEELMRSIWPDSYVEEVNLSQNISLLRKALGDQAQGSRYISTVPGRGYRFTEKVRLVPESNEIVLRSSSMTQVVIDEHEQSSTESSPAQTSEISPTRGRRALLAGSAILALVAAAVAFRPSVAPPRVIRIRQLTHLGTLLHNTRLFSDGPRVYFRAWEGTERVIRFVTADGGEVFPAEKAFPDMDVEDLSPSGTEFLVVNYGDTRTLPDSKDRYFGVWRVPLPSGSPRPLGDVHARDARWSPDGQSIAYSVGSILYLINPDGSNVRKLATLPGEPIHLVWSPDGEYLRFAIADAASNGTSLWQLDLSSKTVRPSLPDWRHSGRVLAGGWTPDDRYFFYSAMGDGATGNIWAIRKDELWRRLPPQPTQITAGPLTFYVPLPGKDGKSVFAVGEQLRGELVRYDAATRQFVPYAQGLSADHVSFSRDGRWMAYVEFPGQVLVRSRTDGSERLQLTFPPMRAFSPQWSPDGSQIAVQAEPQMGARSKIYLIQNSGGAPVMAAPESQDRQTYPSWTADGEAIIFSGSEANDSSPALYRLDLKAKHASLLPGSSNLYWGQISPDGHYVAALEDSNQRLMLYDTVAHSTRTLAELADYPCWSADGRYVYFSTLFFAGHGGTGGVFRWNVSTNTTEMVIRAPDFPLTGIWGVHYSLTPDGAVLLLRDAAKRDLYALDMELP